MRCIFCIYSCNVASGSFSKHKPYITKSGIVELKGKNNVTSFIDKKDYCLRIRTEINTISCHGTGGVYFMLFKRAGFGFI
jgi:hypothetical protein